MSTLLVYITKQKYFVDINAFLDVIKFLILNITLAIIFIFLIIEEIEWTTYASDEDVSDKVIDNSSWNLRSLFLSLVKI